MEADNRALERAGMPYRYGPDGIALCASCGATYFRADRVNYPNSDCPHYDQFFEKPDSRAPQEEHT